MAEDQIYLTTDKNPNGKGLLAVISLGSPQLGDANVIVLTVEIVEDQAAAIAWYKRMMEEQPWVERN